MTIDLSECRAKIERARDHRNGLDAVVQRAYRPIGEAKLFQMDAKLDPQSGYHIFRLAAIPEDWRLQVGVILGDVVHNLRGALEYLFFQLCCHYLGTTKTERLGGQVQFPIEDTSQGLANKRMHFKEIPSSHWVIIEWAQPYEGPYEPHRAIRALRNLSNRDKHRVLNPLLLTSTLVDFTDKVPVHRATGEMVFRQFERLEVGAEVVRMPFPSDVDAEMKMAGYVIPNVRFPEWDTSIHTGVDGMIFAVELIVGRIETLP